MIDWPNQTVSAVLNLAVGLVAGVGSGLMVVQLQDRNDGRTNSDPKTSAPIPVPPAVRPPDWSKIIITNPPSPGRSARSSFDPAPAPPGELWPWILLELAAMVIFGTVYVVLADWIAVFLYAFVVGLIVTVVISTLTRTRHRQSLPPGAVVILARTLVVAAVSLSSVALTYASSYRGITLDRVHHLVVRVSGFQAQIRSISTNFHTDGWAFISGLLLGICAVTILLAWAAIDLLTVLAAQRMGNGSSGKVTAWVARRYPDHKDLNRWGFMVLLMLASIGLCSGLAVNAVHPGHPSNPAPQTSKFNTQEPG